MHKHQPEVLPGIQACEDYQGGHYSDEGDFEQLYRGLSVVHVIYPLNFIVQGKLNHRQWRGLLTPVVAVPADRVPAYAVPANTVPTDRVPANRVPADTAERYRVASSRE